MRPLARGLLAAGGALLAVCVMAPPASAHAQLIRSTPPSGAVLAAAPSTVQLWFSEEIAPGFASAQVVDDGGRTVPGARVSASPEGVVTVRLPRLNESAYGVVWRVLSEDDGHPTSGVVAFSVGRGGSAADLSRMAPVTPLGPAPIDVLLRWLRLCCLSGVIGGLAIAGLVVSRAITLDPAGPAAPALNVANRRLVALAAAGAVLAVVMGVAEEFRRVIALEPVGSLTGALLRLGSDTRAGQAWMLQEIVLVVTAGVALLILVGGEASRAVRRRRGGLTALLLVSLALLEAAGSHAAAVDQARLAAVGADALHVLAACVWLGAVPALIAVLWWPGTDRPTRRVIVGACRRPFSVVVVGSVCLLVVTGVYGAGLQVETVQGLITTAYGRVLLVKCALLAVLGGLGLANSARLHGGIWWPGRSRPESAGHPSRRLVSVEAGVGALLLIAAALLAQTPPARGPTAAVTATAGPSFSGATSDLVVSVTATPDRPGLNGFTVVAASSRRPPPAPVDGAELLIEGTTATAVPLRPIGDDRYVATATISRGGPPEVTVRLHRSGHWLSVQIPWRLAPPSSAKPAKHPGRQLQAYTNALALTLTAALALLALLAVVEPLRGRRRTPTALHASDGDVPAPMHVVEVGK